MKKMSCAAIAFALVATAGATVMFAQRGGRGVPIPRFDGPFTAPMYTYEVVRTYPHDTKALTQGLVYKDGFLYETTGERGTSSLRKVELATGKVVQRYDVDPMQQAEGLAEHNGRWYQMTLLNGYGRIFDQAFKEVGKFDYGFTAEFGGSPTAAWAIAFVDGRMIIVTPTSTMHVFDPDTMKETAQIIVKDGPNEINRLDEMELVKGELWINIYQTPRIAVVDPKTGVVKRWVDLSGLAGPNGRGQMPEQTEGTPDWVLNGIAYDAQGDRLFVTGKNWPSIFEIKVKPRS